MSATLFQRAARLGLHIAFMRSVYGVFRVDEHNGPARAVFREELAMSLCYAYAIDQTNVVWKLFLSPQNFKLSYPRAFEKLWAWFQGKKCKRCATAIVLN